MTAAELRAALADLPDDTPVLVRARFEARDGAHAVTFDDGEEVVADADDVSVGSDPAALIFDAAIGEDDR